MLNPDIVRQARNVADMYQDEAPQTPGERRALAEACHVLDHDHALTRLQEGRAPDALSWLGRAAMLEAGRT